VRRVLVTVVAVAAISLGLAAVATALTDHHRAIRDAAIQHARCHYNRRSNRVIAMATLTNPNGSPVPFSVGAS
jgi:hypothetical protein